MVALLDSKATKDVFLEFLGKTFKIISAYILLLVTFLAPQNLNLGLFWSKFQFLSNMFLSLHHFLVSLFI